MPQSHTPMKIVFSRSCGKCTMTLLTLRSLCTCHACALHPQCTLEPMENKLDAFDIQPSVSVLQSLAWAFERLWSRGHPELGSHRPSCASKNLHSTTLNRIRVFSYWGTRAWLPRMIYWTCQCFNWTIFSVPQTIRGLHGLPSPLYPARDEWCSMNCAPPHHSVCPLEDFLIQGFDLRISRHPYDTLPALGGNVVCHLSVNKNGKVAGGCFFCYYYVSSPNL